MEVPDGSMVLGMPGKIKKELSLEEQAIPALNAHHYIENYKRYKALLGDESDG
jgi:carbonic anhydrase/acetyltransferase-like protein (isoleucine patch superfamily)